MIILFRGAVTGGVRGRLLSQINLALSEALEVLQIDSLPLVGISAALLGFVELYIRMGLISTCFLAHQARLLIWLRFGLGARLDKLGLLILQLLHISGRHIFIVHTICHTVTHLIFEIIIQTFLDRIQSNVIWLSTAQSLPRQLDIAICHTFLNLRELAFTLTS